MPAFIHVDPNTFKVEVRHDLKTPVFPTELLLEVQKLSDQIVAQLKDFLDNKHNPMVKQLVAKAEEFNLLMNPELAAKKLAAAQPPPTVEEKVDSGKVVKKQGSISKQKAKFKLKPRK